MVNISSALCIAAFLLLCFGCGIKKIETASAGQTANVKKMSIVEKMKNSGSKSLDDQIILYRQLKKENPDAYNFENEDELTMYGYSFLWNNNTTDALKIFQLIVDEFNSANSYDSLGEAYLAAGDSVLALKNYKQSFEMNPENFVAEDQIEFIQNPKKKPLTPAEKFDKKYSEAEYKSDLDQLGRKLLEVHPNALKFISEQAFWETVEAKKSLITPNTTYADFVWHCDEIIANINCSHTSLGRFFQETDMLPDSVRFPMQVRLIEGKLFVIDALANADRVKLKDEILRINGISVADLTADIYKHISSQGYTTTSKKQFFNTWAAAMIPYALSFPETYSVTLKGINEPITLKKSKGAKDIYRDPSIKSCGEELCLEIINEQTAVLTISSFVYYPWNNLSVFTDFIDKSMKTINEKKIQNLIIDVRFNGGGSKESSIHLLRYLVNKEFIYYSKVEDPRATENNNIKEIITPFENRFKGNQYYLIDGEGNSTTGHFMSLVKVLELGIIVGEELGSNQFCSGGQTVCRLSNTKLVYYVANNTHVSSATSLPDETGILPDYYVTQSIDDYFAKKDAVKEFALSLIKKE
jgi:C-terminal processing protease CtpA/Prc